MEKTSHLDRIRKPWSQMMLSLTQTFISTSPATHISICWMIIWTQAILSREGQNRYGFFYRYHPDIAHVHKEPISVDNIIARRRLQPTKSKRKRDTSLDEDEESDISMGDSYQERGHSINAEGDEFTGFASSGKEEDPLGTSEDYGPSDREEILSENEQDEEVAASSSGDDFETETQAEKERKAAFFAPDVISSEEHSSFLSMNLSRPIIKSITTLGFHTPTPIQAATIPVALLGKDVVGNAVTGSGKTAAFIIPMLERLMYRDRGKKAAATRCLILVPTRELGVQCFEVGAKLAAHTDIRFCLVVGT